MKRSHAKGTNHPSRPFLDLKRYIPEKQLASLGALALIFNEVEATLDRLFFVVTGLPESLQLEVSTRINGIDGKIEIITEGAKNFLSQEEWPLLTEALGSGCFKLLKTYRDGVIHARHVNSATGLGVKVDSRARVFDFLIRQDALDAAYSILEALDKELYSILVLTYAAKANNEVGSDDPKKEQTESILREARSQF